MRIERIEIKDFRGIKEGSYDFEGDAFVLVSAPNGCGKTTLIDAIEWGLTGNIGRISAVESGRGSQEEKKKTSRGVLKHKNAGKRDEVRVEMIVRDNEENIYKIIRTNKNDVLDDDAVKTQLSKVKIEDADSNEVAQEWLSNMIGKGFYQHHFCDLHKSFSIQTSRRESLMEQFQDFITDYSKQGIVADNLDTYVHDIDKKIEVLERKQQEYGVEAKKAAIDSHNKEQVIQISYPQNLLYEDEKVAMEELDKEAVQDQLAKLYACGYAQVGEYLSSLEHNNAQKDVLNKLEKIHIIMDEKKEKIQQAEKDGLNKEDSEKIKDLRDKIDKLKKVKLSRDNIWIEGLMIVSYNDPDFTEDDYVSQKKSIQEKEEHKAQLEADTKLMVEGNQVVSCLADLVSRKDNILEYRRINSLDGKIAPCPVCGSEQFSTVAENEILKGAEEYVKKTHDTLAQKKKELNDEKTAINKAYQNLIERGMLALTRYIETIETETAKLERIKKETADFFASVKKLNEVTDNRYPVSKILELDFEKEKEQISSQLLQENEAVRIQKEAYDILDLIGYKVAEGENLRAIQLKIQAQIAEAPKMVSGFSVEDFANRIRVLSNKIEDEKYAALVEDYRKTLNNNAKVSKEIEELQKLKERANDRKNQIRGLVAKLKKDEFDKVGPNLYKFYKKLARINTIETIDLQLDNDGSVEKLILNDETGKNIVNILSNGQLSVFMLAYFFASILSRVTDERFPVYFIDDLTSCMDDINMLAFLDLMKYQLLTEDGVIDQLFFSSCDERICELLRYKMEGCGIKVADINGSMFQ